MYTMRQLSGGGSVISWRLIPVNNSSTSLNLLGTLPCLLALRLMMTMPSSTSGGLSSGYCGFPINSILTSFRSHPSISSLLSFDGAVAGTDVIA